MGGGGGGGLPYAAVVNGAEMISIHSVDDGWVDEVSAVGQAGGDCEGTAFQEGLDGTAFPCMEWVGGWLISKSSFIRVSPTSSLSTHPPTYLPKKRRKQSIASPSVQQGLDKAI